MDDYFAGSDEDFMELEVDIVVGDYRSEALRQPIEGENLVL